MERTKLLQSTTSDIHMSSYITAPQNDLAIQHLLRATGLGHTLHLWLDKHHHPANGLDESDSHSPEPDFGSFEPCPCNDNWGRRDDGQLLPSVVLRLLASLACFLLCCAKISFLRLLLFLLFFCSVGLGKMGALRGWYGGWNANSL